MPNSIYGSSTYFLNHRWSKVYLDYKYYKEYFFYKQGEKINQCEKCYTKWIEQSDSSSFYMKVLSEIDSTL
jgi:hypothetical protein